jgi:acyl-CoA synthetase (AMP-forming)/AMP-acid ligase II
MEYPLIVHSLLYLGIPFALYATYATIAELTHQLRVSKPTRIFCSTTKLASVLKAAEAIGLDPENVHVFHGRPPKKHRSLTDAIEKTISIAPVAVKDVNKDALAYLVFSSGTSGLPKGVMITHGNLIAVFLQYALLVKIEEAMTGKPVAHRTTIGFLPMYHSMGFILFIFRPFISPITVVIMPKWNPEQVLELVPKYQVNTLVMVPSLVHQLVHHPTLNKSHDLSSLKVVGTGAAYLSPALAEEFKKKLLPHRKNATDQDLQYGEGYGLSEATLGVLLRAPPVPGENMPVVAAPMILNTGMEGLLLIDENGKWRDAKVDEPGELFVRGESIAKGYWNNPEATKQTFGYSFESVGGGWLRTGDRFTADKHQRFVFQDRSKDILKVSGSQVTPTELETTLMAQPDRLIVDACVAGVTPARTTGSYAGEQVPRAWVVLSPAGKKLGAKEVKKRLDEWVKHNLSKYKWLTGGIEAVDEIPKSATGKVLRRQLQEQYESKRSIQHQAKL